MRSVSFEREIAFRTAVIGIVMSWDGPTRLWMTLLGLKKAQLGLGKAQLGPV